MTQKQSARPTPFGDLLDDPILHMLMRADGVTQADLAALLDQVSLHFAAASDPSARDPEAYRAGVGVMLLNTQRTVFVGARLGVTETPWQMPQGGIEANETPRQAALRELEEETGINRVRFVTETPNWFYYDLPADLVGRAWNGRWRGQRQKWVLLEFNGDNAGINVATEHPEFSAWRWVEADKLPTLAVDFKRDLYVQVLEAFEPYWRPNA